MTYCPRCQRSLEVPPEFDSVICPACATVYRVLREHGVLSLSKMPPKESDSQRTAEAEAVIESRLAEIDELIEEAESEIDSLRGRRQSVPLQIGCALFGIFVMIVVVIALFMLFGKGYLGGWLFFALIGAAILFGLTRIRRKLLGALELDRLRQEQMQVEDDLAQLEGERVRLLSLKARLSPEEPSEKQQPER